LQLKLWRGDGGFPEVEALQARVEAQRQENARLQQRNDALEAEVEDLKSGAAAIEDRARSELGMIRPGEVFFRVVEPTPGGDAPPPAMLPEGEGAAEPAPGDDP